MLTSGRLLLSNLISVMLCLTSCQYLCVWSSSLTSY